MKFCPQCNSPYDDSMFFCLEDGTPLRNPNDLNLEQTIALSTKNDRQIFQTTEENNYKLTSSFEETVALPKELPTQEFETEKTSNFVTTNQNPINNNYSNSQRIENTNSILGKGIVIFLGIILGGLVLAISGFIGWRISQDSSKNDVVILTNSNQQNVSSESNTNSVSSNFENINSAQIKDNSAEKAPSANTNNNSTLSANNNTDKQNPKPSPTQAETATPTPKSTPSVTPTVKTTPTPVQSPSSTPPKTPPETVSAGVLNGRAVLLFQPVYPPAAKANNIGGSVNVQVLINESGKVVSANAVSGHDLLKQTAEKAALSSKFSPTKLNGQPVKVTGIIVYRFIP